MDQTRASLFQASSNPPANPHNAARKTSIKRTPSGKSPPKKSPSKDTKNNSMEDRYKSLMDDDTETPLLGKEPSPKGSRGGQPASAPQQKQKKTKAQKPPKPPPPGLNMKNRDPYELNSHVRANFDEVIGEPEGAYSDECIWVNSYKGFDVGRVCCYTCLTYVCAIPLAFCWGCQFACITFMHIWSVTPLYRVFRINCDCAGKFFSAIVHCWCDPCYEALALMFTKIYVHVVNTSTTYTERTYRGVEELVVNRSMPHKQGGVHGGGMMGKPSGDASRIQLEFNDGIEESDEEREYDNIPLEDDPKRRV